MRVLICAWLILGLGTPAVAQTTGDLLRTGSMHLVASALVSGGIRALRGGSFVDGAIRGAEGGAVLFLGKYLASRSNALAQAPGRLVGQVGSSLVRNAALGKPRFSEISVGAGPFWLEFNDGLRVRVDAVTLAVTLYAVTQPEYTFDPAASLRYLAPTFRRPPFGFDGMALNGTVWFDPDAPSPYLYGHEAVHVVQHDALTILLYQPLMDELLSRVPALRPLAEHVSFNMGNLPYHVLSGLLYGPARFRYMAEAEADAIDTR